MTVPLPLLALESVQRFETHWDEFVTWRDTLPVEEQVSLAFHGARVIWYEDQPTQELPIVKVNVPVSSSPAASAAPALKPRRKQAGK